jgi:hypothetical protein
MNALKDKRLWALIAIIVLLIVLAIGREWFGGETPATEEPAQQQSTGQ